MGKNIALNMVLANQQQPIIMQGTVGEKRRYESITSKLHFDRDSEPPSSPIATRLRSNNNANNNETPRETLVAARRQPVKVIIHNPGVRRLSVAASHQNNKIDSSNESDVLPSYPLKRGRISNGGRPSLDFEKMRELQRLVVSSVCGIGSQEFVDSAMSIGGKDIEKRKHDWVLTSSSSGSNMSSGSSGGRRCVQHQQARCQQTDCTFRPVDCDVTQFNIGGSNGNTSGGGTGDNVDDK
ncbi:unnamed protein product [Thelazia callipaeda]|uniref:Uncharacterized protein n=1 Tax=Thelazia callipaeda TaxID=103827 RepID=A0A0N5CQM3_THECL|nr:unnamed protein product [Thelazia callipaeda]